MKSIISAYTAFSVVILGIIMSIFSLNRMTVSIENLTNQLEEQVRMETWDKAKQISTSVMTKWEHSHDKISIFANHQEIDNIENEMAKLHQYIKVKNKDESLASIHVLEFYIHHIRDLEKVNFQNIF